jgi:hypothetical protein
MTVYMIARMEITDPERYKDDCLHDRSHGDH